MDVALLTANCAQLRQVSKTLQSVSDRYPIPDPTQYSMTIPNPYPIDFQNNRVSGIFWMFPSACEKNVVTVPEPNPKYFSNAQTQPYPADPAYSVTIVRIY